MKANEAPEKIYIQSFNVSEEDEKFARLLYFDDVWTEEPEIGQTNIEYTRTDAFIEKACKWIEEFNNHNHIMRYSDSCEPPLSELTEWFKNYMKGE